MFYNIFIIRTNKGQGDRMDYKEQIILLIQQSTNEEKLKLIYRFVKRFLG